MTDKGWDKLIDPLIKQCEVEDTEIHQIKEKFGGLRFYVSSTASLLLKKMIDIADRLYTPHTAPYRGFLSETLDCT